MTGVLPGRFNGVSQAPGFIDRGGETVTLRRSTRSIVKGKAVESAATIIEIRAYVQNANEKAIEAMGRGERFSEMLEMYCRIDNPPLLHDKFTRNGNEYEIEKVEPWPRHFRCYAVRV